MTDTPPNDTPPPTPPQLPATNPQPPNNPLADDRQMAIIVYIAYLAAFAFPPVAIAGLVLAYVNRETAPDWLKSHYTFQIYTFWIGILFWFVSILTFFVLIGFLLMFAAMAWYVVRCALGINRLMLREAYPNPTSWIT
ncbi:MAG TPA: hypothetical protein VG248_14130 [Caulobacteraceae bacterium]|jgi:uncharacterized membrane protein|nr:hypothetical protein [Caulobacteraceae bacterium]